MKMRTILTFTVVCMIIAMGCGGKSTPLSDKEKKAIKHFKSLNAIMQYHDDGHVKYVDFGPTKATDEDMVYIKDLDNLWLLALTHSDIGDNGLKHIKENKTIRDLDLRNCKVTDDGLKYLYEMNQLNSITYGDTKITKDGLKKLQSKLPNAKLID